MDYITLQNITCLNGIPNFVRETLINHQWIVSYFNTFKRCYFYTKLQSFLMEENSKKKKKTLE